MRATHLILALGILVATPPLVAAQDHDPTTSVKGSGLPDGWMLRFDPPRRGPVPPTTAVNFRAMGPGWHLTSGPAALYYRTADRASGNYTVSATISQAKSSGHEAYGLFIGGNDLQGAKQNYVYMVVHAQGGKFLINHRTSDAPPTSLVAYTESSAVHKEDASTGAASNTLAIRVQGDMLHFLINGTEVKTLKASEIPDFSTTGIAGLRLNHNLDVHIADFGVKK
ncbi:MAG TPA: hypothetical protein VFN22_07280 [Gemmatimonadales bacterium]|nr:hypothetical protein [Gemmatimonadales bacterium]